MKKRFFLFGILSIILSSNAVGQEISGENTVLLYTTYTYIQDAGPCGEYCDYYWEVTGPANIIVYECEDSVQVSWTESGSATVTLWIDHTNGPTNWDEISVVVDNPPSVEYAYDAAGNRFLRRVVYLAESSKKSLVNDSELVDKIESDDNQRFNVYPNPTTQHVFVALNTEALESNNSRILLYNNLGKLLQEVVAVDDIVNIDLSEYPNGVYFIKLIYGNESKECKIIKY